MCACVCVQLRACVGDLDFRWFNVHTSFVYSLCACVVFFLRLYEDFIFTM